MMKEPQLYPERLTGCYMSLYGLLLFAIVTYQTSHALNPHLIWFNLLPVAVLLLGLDLIYGTLRQIQRVVLLVNAAMILCLLVVVYQVFVFSWPLLWALCRHQFFQSSAFYLLNAVILGVLQWRLQRQLNAKPFWHYSPWRGGLAAAVVGGVLLLYGLGQALQPLPFEVTIPATNLVHYLQGSELQFTPVRVSYQKQGAAYQLTASGYGFSSDRAVPMQVSWVPVTPDVMAGLKAAAQKGNAAAQLTFGVVSLAGLGAQSDIDEAVKWFTLAARQANPGAQQALAIAAINGAGMPMDIAQGYLLLKKAAAGGNAQAKRLVAKIVQQTELKTS